MFVENKFYTRKQINNKLGGSLQAYLPTVKRYVVCECLTKSKNPDAPNIILVGDGLRVRRNAELLCSQKESIPVFVKIKTNKWQFVGEYKVAKFNRASEEIAKYSKKSGRKNISLIIYLSQKQDSVNVDGLGSASI